MNGFIYSESGGQTSRLDLKKGVPFDAQMVAEEKSFVGGDMLLAWGNPAADVCYFLGENNLLLVLCGYVSEVRDGPIFEDQKQAASFLFRSIEVDSSASALATLLDRVHGSFSFFYRDSRRGVSLCATDRVASRPLWKMWNGTGWIISSHANAIAFAVPSVKVDFGALGAFMLYGGPVEPRKSLYAGVEAILPGSVVKLCKNAGVEESRWYRFRHQADEHLSLSAWIDLAAERLVCSASRIARQSERPAVFFSGGVDSRLTAAALKAAGANPLLVTLGDSRNLEVGVSERAAKAMSLQHVVILRDKHWYLRGLPKAVYETGGSFLWTHGHFAKAIYKLREEYNADVFFLGDFCEAFSKLLCSVEKRRRNLWTPEEFARDFDQVRPPEYRPKNRDRTLSLLNSRIRGEVETSLSQDIVRRYKSMSGASIDPRIIADQFSRSESAATISSFFMFLDVRSVAAERNLMFDKDVHALLETLPSHLRDGANLGALLVKRLAPRASKVVNSNSLLPICWPLAAHKLSKKCKPIMGKARRFILGDSYRTTGAWPEKAVLYVTDPIWRNYFDKELAGDELFRDDLFDRDRVHGCWRALVNGEREFAGDIEKLVQFGILSNIRSLKSTCVAEEGSCL